MTQNDTFIRDSIDHGVAHLIKLSGENSRDHGFHESWPVFEELMNPEDDAAVYQSDLELHITQKLALIHEEVSEALGEIRSGHDPLATYFLDKGGKVGEAGSTFADQVYGLEDGKQVPLLKPEGFLVELADAVIRIADLVYLVDGADEFLNALEVKHEYNATRPFKHGRKF